MAALRYLSRKLILNQIQNERNIQINTCGVCVRLLNYSSIEYDSKTNPMPIFFNRDVQSLLRILTRRDLAKVFRRRKLGDGPLRDPEYKFMTDEELDAAVKKAEKQAEELLQIPPVVPVRKDTNKVFSKDPALQGLETAKLVFTDITFGIKDKDRLVTIREPDGTLRDADWEVRKRMNQTYFPAKGRDIKPPRMFEDRYLESLLDRQEYEFILDSACSQFEPDDPEYQRVVSVTYQHLNDKNNFESLRSTRHFGALTFFLVWNKEIDNLLLDLLETAKVDEGKTLLELYSIVHNVKFENTEDVKIIEEYIAKYSNKKAALELGLQAFKDLLRQREDLDKSVRAAHSLS